MGPFKHSWSQGRSPTLLYVSQAALIKSPNKTCLRSGPAIASENLQGVNRTSVRNLCARVHHASALARVHTPLPFCTRNDCNLWGGAHNQNILGQMLPDVGNKNALRISQNVLLVHPNPNLRHEKHYTAFKIACVQAVQFCCVFKIKNHTEPIPSNLKRGPDQAGQWVNTQLLITCRLLNCLLYCIYKENRQCIQ